MLAKWIHSAIPLALAQAAITAAAAFAIALAARRRKIHIERETAVALARGFTQVVAVGSVLLFVFRGPWGLGLPILAAMIVLASSMSTRRAKGFPGAFTISLAAIAIGGGCVIFIMTWLGVIDPRLPSLIPVGSMLIANAMNTNSLTLDRLKAEILAHAGQIEAALALGAHPHESLAPHIRSAIMAGLIPRLDTLRSLGIVWIPGIMTGMILAGSSPIHAAIYQFVIIAMIFTSAALTALAACLLARKRVFSPAQQLLLRPGRNG